MVFSTCVPLPMSLRVALAPFCLIGGLALLLVGCGTEPGPNVPEGRYRLYVEGSLTDTLTGPATVHPHRNGRIGIELGALGESGLSIELASQGATSDANAPRVHPGRYDVVAAPVLNSAPSDSLSGLLAFLSVAGRQFTATQGHLSVTHVDDEGVGGQIDVQLQERSGDFTPEHTVRVTGVLHATSSQ